MKKTVLDKIIEIKDVLPKKQKLLCNYLALNYGKVGVMTVAELAENAGVGTTTIMRFIQLLGYSSYTQFKKDLTNLSLMQNSAPYRSLKETFSSDLMTESNDVLKQVLLDCSLVLENLYNPSNVDQFEKAIQLLLAADTIFTLGLRSSKALALYFDYLVDRFYPKVTQLSHETDFIYDKVIGHMRPTDVLLIFNAYPCTKKSIHIGNFCHNAGIPIILVTNTRLNPLTKIANVILDTNSVNSSSGDVALFALVEALAAELGRRAAPASTESIEHIEQVLTEKDIFEWG